MRLVYYKQKHGHEEEKTTLSDLVNIAENYGMDRVIARDRLNDCNDGECIFENIRLWSEEA